MSTSFCCSTSWSLIFSRLYYIVSILLPSGFGSFYLTLAYLMLVLLITSNGLSLLIIIDLLCYRSSSCIDFLLWISSTPTDFSIAKSFRMWDTLGFSSSLLSSMCIKLPFFFSYFLECTLSIGLSKEWFTFELNSMEFCTPKLPVICERLGLSTEMIFCCWIGSGLVNICYYHYSGRTYIFLAVVSDMTEDYFLDFSSSVLISLSFLKFVMFYSLTSLADSWIIDATCKSTWACMFCLAVSRVWSPILLQIKY